MNSTYTECMDHAEMRWRLERVRIIASIESEMNAELREQKVRHKPTLGSGGWKVGLLCLTRLTWYSAFGSWRCCSARSPRSTCLSLLSQTCAFRLAAARQVFWVNRKEGDGIKRFLLMESNIKEREERWKSWRSEHPPSA